MAEPFFPLRLIDKMGMHTSDTGDITFDNVRIPHDYLIGEEGKGFFYQMQTFQNERMLVSKLVKRPLLNLCGFAHTNLYRNFS